MKCRNLSKACAQSAALGDGAASLFTFAVSLLLDSLEVLESELFLLSGLAWVLEPELALEEAGLLESLM